MSTAITTNKGGGASLKNLSKYQNIFNTYTLEKVSFYKMVPGKTDGVHRIQEKTKYEIVLAHNLLICTGSGLKPRLLRKLGKTVGMLLGS